MNYYIKGDAANADQIKAAFNGKGIYSNCNFANENYLYYQCDGKVAFCFIGGGLANIIKTHPDYKELELQVKHDFNVGDWVVIDNCHNSTYQVECVREYDYMLKHTHGGLMPFPFSSAERLRLWSIADAKDGDVLVTTKIRSCPFIYRKTVEKNGLAYYYAGIDGNGSFCEDRIKRTLFHFGLVSDVIPATKEQRDILFQKMKEAGYEWDADKKELRKIKPHYDISNFHAGMPVLVRDGDCDDDDWTYALFSHYNSTRNEYKFSASGDVFSQCIPYNDDTKHLLGTTDMCDEMYINW